MEKEKTETKPTIKTFTDLIAWQKSHELTLLIYKITDKFPAKEIYSLTNQIRRSAISIVSNIAEGFSRQTLKEKIQFYYIALGSNTELQSQILISKDLNYVSELDFKSTHEKITTTNKLINGLIKKLKEIQP